MVPPKNSVVVRMYRTGLGDCFLLAFPRQPSAAAQPKVWYMLIDCGVFRTTENAKNRMRAIAADIKAATAREDDPSNSFIDVLMITHEHWDHISGFHSSQARDIFEQIEIGSLFMAWTEDEENNGLARDLHSGMRATRQALAGAITHMRAANGETKHIVESALSFFGPGAGDDATSFGARKSVETEAVMKWLRHDYPATNKEFLHPAELRSFAEVPELRMYVLGPPESAYLINKHEPGPRDDVYHVTSKTSLGAAFLEAVDGGSTETALDSSDHGRRYEPFDGEHRIEKSTVERDKELEDPCHEFFRKRYHNGPGWRKIETDWLAVSSQFALQLDGATNNTSLAIALEIGAPGVGKVLLFPGDAQVGNWLSWFGKVEIGRGPARRLEGKDMIWHVGDKKIDAHDLLRRTVLYKVGHHGSHNATLVEQGVKLMGQHPSREFVAMLPVDEVVAKKKAHYGEMPKGPLVDELLKRSDRRLMRCDEGNPRDDVDKPTPDGRDRFKGKRVTDLYIEYVVSF